MALSEELVSQFVKVTSESTKTKKETTVYGTTVEYNGSIYVKIDGSDLLTPISTTTNIGAGERVMVMIKNHTATITGNISSPSARMKDISDISDVLDEITELEILIAGKVSTDDFDAQTARIDDLAADNVTIKKSLEANSADIDTLQANVLIVTESIETNKASIEELEATKLDADIADITYVTIDSLDATNANLYNLESTYASFASTTTDRLSAIDADITDLDAKKLDADTAAITYANIDFSNIGKAAMEYFYAQSGLIENVTVGDGTITGNLVGVTIKGDLIEGNTIVADKLVIQGIDGLYYKLNTDGATIESEQTDQNSLNGSVIMAQSITATKIAVDDLVAFDATIAGLHITDGSIYSGTKDAASNMTRGLYLDSEGQLNVGDDDNFIMYYKNADGTYKLSISADNILLHSKTVEATIQTSVDDIEIGGRNLLLNSETKNVTANGSSTMTIETGQVISDWNAENAIRIYGTSGTSTIFGYMTGVSGGNTSLLNKDYVFSIYVKNNHTSNAISLTNNGLGSSYVQIPAGELARVVLFGTGDGTMNIQFNFAVQNAGEEFDITYWHPKIEFGNKVTDWTPAPEDMATAEEVNHAQESADKAQEIASTAESLIKQLSDSISMLVTDGNGTSLMTQTDDGWTFSTSEIQAAVDTTSEGLDALTNEVGNTNGVVSVLQQAVNDLGVLADYIKIGTYEDEPCIELGEADSEFKLRITNTRIMFMEGSGIPAYFTNQSMHIKNAVVEEELQQGGFVWKARSNGNLGLVWKGVSS